MGAAWYHIIAYGRVHRVPTVNFADLAGSGPTVFAINDHVRPRRQSGPIDIYFLSLARDQENPTRRAFSREVRPG